MGFHSFLLLLKYKQGADWLPFLFIIDYINEMVFFSLRIYRILIPFISVLLFLTKGGVTSSM